MSIKNIAGTIKKDGLVCYVIGNRMVKGIQLPTNETVINFYERFGFKHIETFLREIPNKRMPHKNSPSNIKGETSSTIMFEYIIILKKV